jgi:hypothetical protein
MPRGKLCCTGQANNYLGRGLAHALSIIFYGPAYIRDLAIHAPRAGGISA